MTATAAPAREWTWDEARDAIGHRGTYAATRATDLLGRPRTGTGHRARFTTREVRALIVARLLGTDGRSVGLDPRRAVVIGTHASDLFDDGAEFAAIVHRDRVLGFRAVEGFARWAHGYPVPVICLHLPTLFAPTVEVPPCR